MSRAVRSFLFHLRWIAPVLFFAIVFAEVFYRAAQEDSSNISPEILQRSRHIVETLARSSPESLTNEERLSVFHAFANLGQTKQCRRWAEIIRPDLKGEEDLRKKAFSKLAESCGLPDIAF